MALRQRGSIPIEDKEIEIRSFILRPTPPPYCLSCVHAILCAAILEDTLSELQILAELNNELHIIKTIVDMDHTVWLKYSVAQPNCTQVLGGLNPKDLVKEKYKLVKLSNDRQYVYETILDLYVDLAMRQSFEAVLTRIDKVLETEANRALIQDAEAKNKALRRELAKQLRQQQRNHFKSVNYDTDLVIDEMGRQLENTSLYAAVRARFVTNWQTARSEQQQELIRVKEEKPLVSIELCKMGTEDEHRVHAEIEVLMMMQISEKLQQVEIWMKKYEKDMEEMDLKIQLKKKEHTSACEKRLELEDIYEKRAELIINWMHFKEEREKARQYHKQMTRAAVAVQAWWRGLLVRRELGPYKPLKKRTDRRRKGG